RELTYFLKWIDEIKERKSQSTALLARRKMGKSALMQRLFNITFANNDGVIPFYYEIQEVKMWLGDFCADFFLTFIYQYIAFKTRKVEYLEKVTGSDFNRASAIAHKEGLDYLCETIEITAHAYRHEQVDILWNIARETPRKIAGRQQEFIVQMIDEFQFLNSQFYRDKNLDKLQSDIAAGYLGTAESKVAPLLVSGSWVGWLMNLLQSMLPARFIYFPLEDLPQDEAVEMIFKYSQVYRIPITEEIAFLMAALTEGSPFYISSLFRSLYPKKDFTSLEGLNQTLEFEILDKQGIIKNSWMEYIAAAFSKVNNRNAKRIVLHLCKNKSRELTRKEIIDDLQLSLTDEAVEEKMKALVHADIVKQGQTNFDYRSVQDNIFDKVFRGVYQKEIDTFDISIIGKEINREFRELKKKYKRLQGKHNYLQGYFAEYLIIDL
ncbi:MAG: hypothetical protein L0Y73_09350, partial [Candidatus Aminicenantes bacterium]|nr:hypothetical protein [Candidatus Aminicenantes bacterium]